MQSSLTISLSFRHCLSMECNGRSINYFKTNPFHLSARYLANDVALERIDPHSVYPTSIYRYCDGCVLATRDSQTIEAVMTTNITTSIKITRRILEPSCSTLSEVYK